MTADPYSTGADRAIARCRQLALLTDVPGETTRSFLSPATHEVHHCLRTWMEAAALATRVDGMGNLRGVPAAAIAGRPRVLLGSHLDTVPNAGAFDGLLGVTLAIEAAEALSGESLPFDLEVIAFSEEEGVRFARPFLGSLAAVGQGEELLTLSDRDGITVARALETFGVDQSAATTLAPEAIAYLEIHIEQGPVLESLGQRVGIVEAIAGQSRLLLRFKGESNHAGTTPMHLRHDALAAAAEWISAAEAVAARTAGLVATVGRVEVHPGASNIIAGEVVATLDVRHASDATRLAAGEQILIVARESAARRGVAVTIEPKLNQAAVRMDGALVDLLDRSATGMSMDAPHLVSGAGHDAMILAAHLPAAMLFVRSPRGLSHHPGESVLPEDAEAALAILLAALRELSPDGAHRHA